MCVLVKTMPTVTPLTDHVLAPQGGWGTNVINHAGRGNMAKTVNMTASAEMGRNVTQPLENVIVLRDGEGYIVIHLAPLESGERSANSNVLVGMEGPATLSQANVNVQLGTKDKIVRSCAKVGAMELAVHIDVTVI